MQRIGGLPVLDEAALTSMTYAQRIPILEAGLETWAGFVGALAYWGTAETDDWWRRYLTRYGEIPRLSGSVDAIESFTSPAVVTLYAGGVAAAAAGRWRLVCNLLSDHPVGRPNRTDRAPLSACIGPFQMYPHVPWPSRRLAAYIGPILSNVVGIGITPTLEGWERFEYINWLVNADRNLRSRPYTMTWPMPYLRVDDDREGRRVTPLMSRWLTDHAEARSVILTCLFESDEDRLSEAMTTSDNSMSQTVDQTETSDLMRRGGSGWMPSGVRRALIAPDQGRDTWPEGRA